MKVKKFENRSIFDEVEAYEICLSVSDVQKSVPYFWATLYTYTGWPKQFGTFCTSYNFIKLVTNLQTFSLSESGENL